VPRICTICQHPDRHAIDKALVGSGTNRRIAAQFAVSEQAIRRHRAEHLPVSLAKTEEAQRDAEAVDVWREAKALRSRAYRILMRAEEIGDLRNALGAIREARATLELLAEVEGQLDRRPTVNVTASPEWVTLRTALLGALRPFPDARQAVVERLGSLDAA
jgi:hypothetical protein